MDPMVAPAPVTAQEFRRTPIIMTPTELDEICRRNRRKGFMVGVAVTTAYNIWTVYRRYKEEARKQEGT